jgi:hypothetical protein
MSCGCAYVESDGETGVVLSQRVQKARKAHRCCACGRKINNKEHYEYVSGIWGDCFDTYKTCVDCLSIRKAFFCGSYCFEFQDDLYYHLENVDGQVKSECLEALTPAARSYIIDMIDEIWEDE